MGIEDWAATDTNGDGFLDLAIRVREAKANTRTSSRHLLNPVFHDLLFLFNGNSFNPTSKTTELKQRLDPKDR